MKHLKLFEGITFKVGDKVRFNKNCSGVEEKSKKFNL